MDASRHQGEIDRERVAADRIDFVYMKATEDRDPVDERLGANWAVAGEAGIHRTDPSKVHCDTQPGGGQCEWPSS